MNDSRAPVNDSEIQDVDGAPSASRAAGAARRVAGVIWALPWTLVGLAAGLAGVLTGGGCGRSGTVIEFWGGWVKWMLGRCPLPGGARALTLGHVVLARSRADAAACRDASRRRESPTWMPSSTAPAP